LPYILPTPADIKLDFPVFADVSDEVIQRRIDRTAIWIDESWLESDFTYAGELVVAHYLTEDGFGKGTDAEMAALGLSGVSRLKSGTLDVTFQASASQGDGDFMSTKYGREFWGLLRKNRGGPRIAHGGGCGIGPQSTDMPYAWRTNGFGL